MQDQAKKPFLLNRTQKVVEVDAPGGSVDFKKRMIELFGPEILQTEGSQKLVLILSRIHDQEADLVGLELAKQGINYVRIDAEDFPDTCLITFHHEQDATFFTIRTPHMQIDSRDICVIWLKHFKFEAFSTSQSSLVEYKYLQTEWNTFLTALTEFTNAKWMNHPYHVHRLNKMKQLVSAQRLGMAIPHTVVSNDPVAIKEFCQKHDNKIIIKSFYHYVETYRELHGVFGHLVQEKDLEEAEELQKAPVIVQELVPDALEIRVTVLNGKVYATEMEHLANGDWHHLDILSVHLKPHQLPESIAEHCLKYLKLHQLEFGAFDFLLTPSGTYYFLEVNPLGDWRWVENSTSDWQSTKPITMEMVQLLKNLLEETPYNGTP